MRLYKFIRTIVNPNAAARRVLVFRQTPLIIIICRPKVGEYSYREKFVGGHSTVVAGTLAGTDATRPRRDQRTQQSRNPHPTIRYNIISPHT